MSRDIMTFVDGNRPSDHRRLRSTLTIKKLSQSVAVHTNVQGSYPSVFFPLKAKMLTRLLHGAEVTASSLCSLQFVIRQIFTSSNVISNVTPI